MKKTVKRAPCVDLGALRDRHAEIADELDREVRPPAERVRLAALPVYSGPRRTRPRVRARRPRR